MVEMLCDPQTRALLCGGLEESEGPGSVEGTAKVVEGDDAG